MEVHPVRVDVSHRSEVAKAVESAENIAPIDVLINNAGIAYETPFLHLEEAEWRKVLDVNLTAQRASKTIPKGFGYV